MAKNSIEIIISAKDLLSKSLTKISGKLQRFGTNLSSIGRQLSIGLTLPLTLLAGAAIKAAVSFESAFAGVKKTVNATEKEFAALSLGIREMTKLLPNSVEEISGVAEAAGQLGIATKDILNFTEVMIGLGTTTNVTAKEAATSIARLANITGLATNEFGNLGSAIVGLGNNFATTEREIIDMSLRIAKTGTIVGLTEQEILAFATALSSVGIQAELGGSAMSRVFSEIASAAKSGGKVLRGFSDTAGLSAEQFAKDFSDKPAKAIVAFIKGLSRIQKAGGNVFKVLEDVGLNNVRVRDSLLGLANAGNVLTDAFKQSNKDFAENIALQEELDKRLATSASQFKILANKARLLAIDLGEALLPFLKRLIEVFEPITEKVKALVQQFKELPARTQATIVKFTLLAALLGPMAIVFGAIATAVGGAFSIVSTFGLAIAAASTLIFRFIGINKVIEIALGVLEALALTWVFAWESIKETFRIGWVRDHITKPLMESVAFLKDTVIVAWAFWLDEINKVKEALPTGEEIFSTPMKSALDGMKKKFEDIRGTIKGLSDDFSEFTNKLFQVPEAFKGGGLVTRGGGGKLGGGEDEEDKNIVRKRGLLEELSDQLDEVRDKMGTITEQVASFIIDMSTSIAQGVGQAFASVIVFGASLMDSLKTLLQQVIAAVIASLIEILVERKIFEGIKAIIEQLSAINTLGLEATKTFAATFASVIQALPYPANVIAAPIQAAITTAQMTAGAKGAGAISSFAEGGIVNRPTLALIGDNPGGQEAIIPLRGGKVPVDLGRGGGGLTIGTLNILPNAKLDETISNKPVSWWRSLVREKVLPALNNLGDRNATTSLKFRSSQI